MLIFLTNNILPWSLKVSKLVFWIVTEQLFISCIIPLWCQRPNPCPLKDHRQSLPNKENRTDVGENLAPGASQCLFSSTSSCVRFLGPILWLISWTLRLLFQQLHLTILFMTKGLHYWPSLELFLWLILSIAIFFQQLLLDYLLPCGAQYL